MRRTFINGFVACVAVFGFGVIISAFVYCARPINPYMLHEDQWRGVDFVLRFAEVDCLRSGVNPFHVWNGDVGNDRYCSVANKDSVSASGKLPVNAYTPWEYTYVYPFASVKDWNLRWCIFTGLRFAAFLFFVIVLHWKIFRLRCRFMDCCICGACLSLTAGAVYADLMPSNTAIFLSAFALGMCVCLNRGWDYRAGILWALLMVKPQIGLLFAVPILIGKRWSTFFVASGICLLASVPPVLMCGDSFFAMLMQAPAASAHGFNGCGLLPLPVFDLLVKTYHISSGYVLFALSLVGVALCLWASWRLRREDDWLVKFFPCAILALNWTYVQSYSYCLAMLPIAVMVMEMIKLNNCGRRTLCLTSVFLFSNSGHDLARLIVRAFSVCGPETSDAASDWIRQICSSLSVVACMYWCCCRRKSHLMFMSVRKCKHW